MKQWIIWFVVLPFVGSWGTFIVGFGFPTNVQSFVNDLKSLPYRIEGAFMDVVSEVEGLEDSVDGEWNLDLEGRWNEVMKMLDHVNPFADGVGREEIRGYARILDGDTIEIDGQRIRLFGIDAPESKQSCVTRGRSWMCGVSAGQVLLSWTQGKEVVCEKRDQDIYGRVVAVCFVGEYNLNAALVASGWAMAFRGFSTEFVNEERWARENGKGIWVSTFEPPWEWRKK